uniref:Pvs-trna-like protein n=1 Tax=Muellerina celastroides TaxID=286087 RepID=A0AA96RRR8_9MAGN|nr:hypothetical protein UYF89_pgp011 [Muellerina celastroides]WNR57507.1 hypothetical protein [Muellerina celastroides]
MGTLGEPPTPTTVHVRSILDLTNGPSYLLYVLDSPSLVCLSRVFQWHVSVLFPITSKKVSHLFRYKILSLPPGQLDIQPVIATTQLQERSSTN